MRRGRLEIEQARHGASPFIHVEGGGHTRDVTTNEPLGILGPEMAREEGR